MTSAAAIDHCRIGDRSISITGAAVRSVVGGYYRRIRRASCRRRRVVRHHATRRKHSVTNLHIHMFDHFSNLQHIDRTKVFFARIFQLQRRMRIDVEGNLIKHGQLALHDHIGDPWWHGVLQQAVLIFELRVAHAKTEKSAV